MRQAMLVSVDPTISPATSGSSAAPQTGNRPTLQ
jgi:hypothetical protein